MMDNRNAEGQANRRKSGAVITRLASRARRKTAATLTEYTFIIAIISIAGVVLLTAIGSATNALLQKTSSNMPQ
jgi:Flp pilus assembly pilin Flp